jgi:ATP-dependent Clp protease ATP-binding subunit ClpA
VLLAILEEGQLVDGAGHTTSFCDTFVVLTSNLRSSEVVEAACIGELSTPAEVIAHGIAVAKQALCAPPAENGKGKPALWSRLQDGVFGYDLLRRPALPALVASFARRVETNLADEGVIAEVEQSGFVAVLDAWLPQDGEWDGRKARNRFADLALAALARAESGAAAAPAGPGPLRLVAA